MASSVTAHTNMDPAPRVDILIDDADLSVETHSITVWQISSAGQFEVRNAVRRAAAGGFFVTDYEVPLGVPVTYRVQEFNSGGTELSFALNLPVQVNVSHGFAFISDPLVPSRAVRVSAEAGFAAQLRQTRPAKVYRAGNNTIALLGQRGLLEDVPLRVWTDDPDVRDTLDLIVAETQFLVRTGPEFPIPRLLHVVVQSPERLPMDYAHGGTTDVWDLTGSQVSRTELEIIVPVVSYARFSAAFATYADFNAAYSTYLDAISNPPPEA